MAEVIVVVFTIGMWGGVAGIAWLVIGAPLMRYFHKGDKDV